MTRRVAVLFLAVLCFACDGEQFAEGQLMFRELLKLRDQIAREFREDVADVTVTNGDRMVVKFVNSPLRSRPAEEKQQRADAVAAFVSKNYRQPLSSVSVEFVTRRGTSLAFVGGAETYTGRSGAMR